MPRQAAQPAKPRKYCRTEFHPDVEAYLRDLSDDVGEEIGYIIRQCVAKALPDVEAALRSGERPDDVMKKPTKALKTRARKPKPIPDVSKQPAPAILTFLETGEMPPEPQQPEPSRPEEPCQPAPEPEPREDRQEPERPAEPPAPPASPPTPDHADASPTPTIDPLQRKLELAKLRRRRG